MPTDKALLPLVTPPKVSERRRDALAAAPAVEFDVEVVRAVVVFVNQLLPAPDRPAPTAEGLAQCLRWIPDVLARRATRFSFDWTPFEPRPSIEAEIAKIMATRPLPDDRTVIPDGRKPVTPDGRILLMERATDVANLFMVPKYKVSAPDWVNQTISKFGTWTILRATRDGLREVAFPVLNSVSAILGYAVALVNTDKHGLSERVRFCPYGYPNRAHLFLDYRTEDGALISGRSQRFCCEAHSNRFRVAKARPSKNPATPANDAVDDGANARSGWKPIHES